MVSKDREYRSFDFNMDSESKVSGRAVVFDTPTKLWEMDGVEYFEQISSRAFDGAKMSDVVLVVNHEGTPAARTKNGTLRLDIRADGMYVDGDLSRSSVGPTLAQDIRNGVFDKMSFAFTVAKQSFDKKTRTVTVERIDRLYDVSVVTFPAYEDTSVSARNGSGIPGVDQLSIETRKLIEAEVSESRAAEAAKRDDARKRIEIMAMLGSVDFTQAQPNGGTE